MTNFTEFPIPTKAGFESLLLQKAQDVATDAQSADQDADRAEAARDASESARDASESARDASEAWAESPTPPDPDDAGSKSSKTWAGIAATAVDNAFWYISDDITSVTVGVGINAIIQDPGPGPYDTVTLEVA